MCEMTGEETVEPVPRSTRSDKGKKRAVEDDGDVVFVKRTRWKRTEEENGWRAVVSQLGNWEILRENMEERIIELLEDILEKVTELAEKGKGKEREKEGTDGNGETDGVVGTEEGVERMEEEEEGEKMAEENEVGRTEKDGGEDVDMS